MGQELTGLAAAGAIEKTFVNAIAKAEQSVVAIARVRKPEPGETFPLEFRPDAFGRRELPTRSPEPTDPDFIPNEYATGVVVASGGLILTAFHVLADNSEYYVRTHDRKVYKAWVKAADPRSDLAVLSIDATYLKPIALGNGSALRRGQIVLTLGNPYAIARDGRVSASWGIVSNLSRKAPPTPGETASSEKRTLHHFGTLIQTDARLNLGTSGGPLLNLKGEMVGLCVALAAVTGQDSNAGYAIPVDETFRRVLKTLMEGREVEYGFLGIVPSNLKPQEVLSGASGIRVQRVVTGTPAARYGLKEGDLITTVDDVPIHEADGLVLQVGRLPVEAVTRLNVLRRGQQKTIDVTLGKYPVPKGKIVTNRPDPWRGMRVDYPTALLDDDRRIGLGLAALNDGVIVTEVETGSPAWNAELRRGMVIARVDNVPIRTPQQFRETVAQKAGMVQLQLVGQDEKPVCRVPPES